MSRLPFYDSIVLDESETEEAILQGKIKKYFKTKNKPYWDEKENPDHRKTGATIQRDVGQPETNIKAISDARTIATIK